jgi:hypothetical protein
MAPLMAERGLKSMAAAGGTAKTTATQITKRERKIGTARFSLSIPG